MLVFIAFDMFAFDGLCTEFLKMIKPSFLFFPIKCKILTNGAKIMSETEVRSLQLFVE